MRHSLCTLLAIVLLGCGRTETLNEEKQEKILIEQLRSELAFFGHDTTNMSDEEIKQGVKYLAKVMGSFGVTANEAANSLRTLGNCAYE